MTLLAAAAALALTALPGWGQCSRDLGSEALAACNRVLADKNLAPADKPEVLKARADQYRGTQRYAEAAKDLDAAIALKPDFVDAWSLRAEVHKRLGRPDLALADYDGVLGLDAQNAGALGWSCMLRGAMGRDLDKGLEHCNVVVASAPQASAYSARGLVYLRKGDGANAAKDFDAALALDPKHAPALYLRGVMRALTGDAAGGKADIDAAAAIDPNVAGLYAAYGVTP